MRPSFSAFSAASRITGGRVEIGLAELEVDDVGPLALERLGALEHLDGQEWLDLPRPPGDHGALRGPRPNPRRRRAARTWASMRGPSLITLTREPGWSTQLIGTSTIR